MTGIAAGQHSHSYRSGRVGTTSLRLGGSARTARRTRHSHVQRASGELERRRYDVTHHCHTNRVTQYNLNADFIFVMIPVFCKKNAMTPPEEKF